MNVINTRALEKLSAAIIVIFVFSVYIYVNYRNKKNWVTKYAKNKEEGVPFNQILFHHALAFFTLNSSELVPLNNDIKLITFLMMIIQFYIVVS